MGKRELYKKENTHQETSFIKYYDPEHGRHLAIRERFKMILEHIKGDEILDVGCGHGLLTHLLPGRNVYGVDINMGSLQNAVKNNKKSVFCHAYAEELPFKSECFDTVSSAEVLEHVYSPDDFVNEIHRVLKPKGTLILTCPYQGKITDKHIRSINQSHIVTYLRNFEIQKNEIYNFIRDVKKPQIFCVAEKK